MNKNGFSNILIGIVLAIIIGIASYVLVSRQGPAPVSISLPSLGPEKQMLPVEKNQPVAPPEDSQTQKQEQKPAPARETSFSINNDDIKGNRVCEEGEWQTFASDCKRPLLSTNEWKKIGPLHFGEITDIKLDPKDHQVIFVSTDSTTLWESRDGAKTWKKATDLPTEHVGPIEIDKESDTIYLGAMSPDGVFVTRDGWKTREGKLFGERDNLVTVIDSLAIDPSHSNVVYAGTENGLFKSSDAGESWNLLALSPFDATDLRTIFVSTKNSTTIFVGTGGPPHTDSNEQGKGAFKTTDGGKTWTKMNLPNNVIKITSTSDESILYALGVKSFYSSRDFGNHWTEIKPPFDSKLFDLEINPFNEQTLFIGTFTGAHTVDLKTNRWEKTNFPSSGPWGVITAIEFDKKRAGLIYIGTSEGLFKSGDLGKTIERVDAGMADDEIAEIIAHPSNPDVIFTGSSCSAGLSKTYDGGNSWNWLGGMARTWGTTGLIDHYIMGIAFVESNPKVMYITGLWGVKKTTDGGKTWQVLQNEFSGEHVHGVAIDQKRPEVVYVGTAGHGEGKFPRVTIFKSIDSGQTWNEIPNGLPLNDATVIHDIAIDPQDSNIIYAATHPDHYGGNFFSGVGRGIYQSKDAGRTWQAINNGLTGSKVKNISIDQENTRIIFAATEDDGLFQTTNGGESWKKIEPVIGANMASAVAINPKNSNDVVVSISGSGVYRSADGGTSWQKFSSGLDELGKEVTALSFNSGGSILYAGTEKNGLFAIKIR